MRLEGLDALARRSLAGAAEVVDGQEEQRARRRQRLAEPDPPPRRQSRWKERAASRHALGLPPYEKELSGTDTGCSLN